MNALPRDVCEKLGRDLNDKLKVLNETLWEAHANRRKINSWLSNFTGEVTEINSERTYALYLLSRLMYYGQREVRALLNAVYRDLFRYPILTELRRLSGNTKDYKSLNTAYKRELYTTRFMGLGGSAKSGSHLIYDFRKANDLPEDVCDATHDAVLAQQPQHSPPHVKRYVFIDDICATGVQASGYSAQYIHPIRRMHGTSVEVFYFMMFATDAALGELQPPHTEFDRVEAVHVLDSSFKCFEDDSRYFPFLPFPQLDRATAKEIASRYGTKLYFPPLGYGDCQLLLSFFYNTPDNTLPIFWKKEATWTPIFERL